MKFSDKTKPLHLETDASGVGLGTSLPQTTNGTCCPRDMASDNNILCACAFTLHKVISNAEKRYSNKEREALDILHGLEKFHHCCLTREVSIITDHNLVVVIFKRDMATLLQRLQGILLRIHQYRVNMTYEPGPDLFMAPWLSRQNNKEDKDEEIAGMQVNINQHGNIHKHPRMFDDMGIAI